MYKRDRALKQQAARQAHVIHGSCGDISLLTNGMMGGGTPGSPEDVKPDPLLLQASLNLYSGTISTSTTSNLISGLIPGLNCVSATAAAPSSSASTGGGHNGSSSPPTAHPHHISHNSHQNSHQSLVPMTASQGFSNSFVHIQTVAIPQPQSPKSHYTQQHRHHHNSQLLQQQQHSPLERGDQSPVGHHHQQHHVQQQHMQALSDIQMQSGHGQNQLHNLMPQRRHANNNSTSVGAGGQENEPHFPPTSSQASPTVIEALRAFQIQSPNIGLDRSVLSPLIAEIKSTMGDETEVKSYLFNLRFIFV